jgi:hypothetical protein
LRQDFERNLFCRTCIGAEFINAIKQYLEDTEIDFGVNSMKNYESPYYKLDNMKILRMHLSWFTFHTTTWHDRVSKDSSWDESQQIVLRFMPSTMSLIHSMVEAINSGWLYSSEVLLRAALERVATIAYSLFEKEKFLAEWKAGWKMGKRPSLPDRIRYLPITSPAAKRIKVTEDGAKLARESFLGLCPSLNSAVHGDEFSLSNTIAKSEGGVDYYNYVNDLNNPEYAGSLCLFAGYLVIFLAMTLDIAFSSYFPVVQS